MPLKSAELAPLLAIRLAKIWHGNHDEPLKMIEAELLKELTNTEHNALLHAAEVKFDYSPRRPMETEREFIYRNLNMFRKAIESIAAKLKEGRG